jgi:hypothetical protein
MARVRISTTVDGPLLERSRRLLGMSDGQLVDRALAALVEEVETRQEQAALDEHPYEDDPDLSWEAPSGPALPYDGDVPAEVLELARRRRGA